MPNNNENKQSSLMMWVMMLCCALPLISIALFGAGGGALGIPTWVIVGGVIVMIAVHFFTMRSSHNKCHDKKNDKTGEKNNIDPVCGMKASNDSFKSDYKNKVYYFCSIHCKEQFVSHPCDYIDQIGKV